MALTKQKVAVTFTEGLSSKVDPNQKELGSVESLDNVSFDKIGRIKKRNGYDKLDTEITNGNTIEDAQRISKYKQELVIFNKTNLYSYSDSIEKWSDKGTVSNIFPTSKSVIRNTYQQSNIDSLSVNGINTFAWEDTRGGIRISMIDESTGNELISDTEISSTGNVPKVQYIGNNIYIIYEEGTSLKYRKINPSNPSTIASAVTIVTTDVSNSIHDSVSCQNRIYFTFQSLSSTLKVSYIDSDDTISSIQEEATQSASGCIDISCDSANRIVISYFNGTNVKIIIKSLTLAANLLAATTVESPGATVNNVTAIESSTGNYKLFYEVDAASDINQYIKTNTVTIGGTVGTASVFVRSCGIASKAFMYEENVYISTIHSSTLQSSIFILNSSAEVISKISQGLCGSLLTYSSLPKISEISEGNFLYAYQIKGRTVSENNTLFSLLGVNQALLDFTSDTRFDSAELGLQLHTNGGVIQSYDGKEIVEHGFHLFPEGLSKTSASASGGSMSDGTYQYVAVYSWTDNKGQQHLSAPSIPLSTTLSGGGSSQKQTISIPTLRITEKSNVVIDLYRTENAGTIFYKVTTVAAPTYNDKTVNTVSIEDTISDATLIARELLYTTGGVLENIAPPSASIIETFNNRIFLSGLEDPNSIQYSKIRTEGKPVEFNDTLIINVNPLGGEIKALATMDDKLVIFKKHAIYYITGDGPNNLGEQDNFTTPELIDPKIGCITPNSVVLTQDGLMFQSSKGIYLIDKSLTVSYIGAPVEIYNDSTINAASTLTNKNIVIFLTNSKALVYDFFVKKWCTYSNHIGLSSVDYQNTYYYIRSNNEVYKQSSGFTDAGSFIKMKLETSWMSFAGLQNYQRVYRALILGEYKDSHKLLIKVAYNHKNTYVQEELINSEDNYTDSVFGESDTFGSESPYGGSSEQYQVRVNFKTQKCQSIKLSIEDSQASDFGESLQISNILFVVGVKSSEFKVGQSNVFKTE